MKTKPKAIKQFKVDPVWKIRLFISGCIYVMFSSYRIVLTLNSLVSVFTFVYLILKNMSNNVRKYRFPVIFYTCDVVFNWFISLLPPIILDNLFESDHLRKMYLKKKKHFKGQCKNKVFAENTRFSSFFRYKA